MRTATEASTDAMRAALAAYDTTTAPHGKDYGSLTWRTVCLCGRVFKAHQGLGLHISAVRRAADKQWDVDYDAHMAAWRNERSVVDTRQAIARAHNDGTCVNDGKSCRCASDYASA